ncbi:MAG: hypothetical protein AAFX99_01100 [Myxococcota bacterium]
MSVRWNLIMLALGSTLIVACDGPQTPKETEPAFPHRAVQATLDQPLDKAVRRLVAMYPGARRLPGPLVRVALPEGGALQELMLFQNVRSARVDTVVVKFAARLTEEERRHVLQTTDVSGIATIAAGDVQEVHRHGHTWRARWGDKQNQLTITVETAALSPEVPTRE